MTTTEPRRVRGTFAPALARGAALLLGLGGLAVGGSAAPAQAAEQVVIENPVAGDSACFSESGVLGQTFTPAVGGDLVRYGFWFAAEDAPAGAVVEATVSIGWWMSDGFLPFHEEDVSFAAPASPMLTMLTSTTPLSLDAGAIYGIMIDFEGVDTCPVSLAPGAALDGGFMFVDEQQADGDLAFRVEMTSDTQPGPYVPPSLSGGPPPAGTVGVPYSFQYTVNGSDAPLTALQEGALPPGITFSEQGLLSGTPTQAGTFTPMLKAYDGDNANLLVAIITIREPGLEEPPPATAPPAAAPAPPAAAATRAGAPAPRGARRLAESGVEPVPALTLAAMALLSGAALAGTALIRRTQRE